MLLAIFLGSYGLLRKPMPIFHNQHTGISNTIDHLLKQVKHSKRVQRGIYCRHCRKKEHKSVDLFQTNNLHALENNINTKILKCQFPHPVLVGNGGFWDTPLLASFFFIISCTRPHDVALLFFRRSCTAFRSRRTLQMIPSAILEMMTTMTTRM